jgi:hypothetical protein
VARAAKESEASAGSGGKAGAEQSACAVDGNSARKENSTVGREMGLESGGESSRLNMFPKWSRTCHAIICTAAISQVYHRSCQTADSRLPADGRRAAGCES